MRSLCGTYAVHQFSVLLRRVLKLQPSIREAFPPVSAYSRRAPQFHTRLESADQKYTFNVHTAAPRSLALVKKTEKGNDGTCRTPRFVIRARGEAESAGNEEVIPQNQHNEGETGREGCKRTPSNGTPLNAGQGGSCDPTQICGMSERSGKPARNMSRSKFSLGGKIRYNN